MLALGLGHISEARLAAFVTREAVARAGSAREKILMTESSICLNAT
jgi:hypothetical protein